ncbi:MAG: methionine--tRNA ligase [Proteobacteria bacterium]|nr:methionine--tRNA ligase [Pseudomonadota bacterium]NBP14804.1 methionine--tRNA ligase [bacterium]
MNKKKFYVTTPIYYATAAPHLGTLYSTLLADIAARWHKVQAIDTFFLTGTDEFGQKVAQAAESAGKDPKSFVDQFIPAYKDLWKKYLIDYTHFIRTTDDYHVKAVQQWIADLQKKGDIYKGAYQGWYCTPCETFLTEKDFEVGTKNPLCPSCQRATSWVCEPCYFFKLSAYQDALLQFYQDNPNFITPKERAAEVVSFVKSGLQDVSISRTTISWGVPFPGDEQHVTYVWADALNNYITGVGYGQEGKQAEFKKWWPADMQVLGKDIVRFHAVYWPAFLMASGLPLPKQLLVHGWIKMGDYKMSKSRGNSIDPQNLLEAYGADAVRYYLTRQLAITQDGQFSIQDLEQKISSDLANDLGNLLQRTESLGLKYEANVLTAPEQWSKQSQGLFQSSLAMIELFEKEMERGYFHSALNHVWKFLNESNAYFHNQEPWKLIKTDKAAFLEILSATVHALKTAGILLWPVMPTKIESLLGRIGYQFELDKDQVALCKIPWKNTFTLTGGTPLFEKPEEKKETVAPEVTQPVVNYIGIEDLAKVELKVGTIIDCQSIPESDKLLKLSVDLGEAQPRCILSGVKSSYSPEQLIGKQGVFVTNLKPRMMLKKYESQGMMLFVKNQDGLMVFATTEKEVPNGNTLQ